MWRVATALCLFCVSAQAGLSPQVASAGWIASSRAPSAASDMIVRVDWQYPWQLPQRFRNHCAYGYFTARPYCSDHCGTGYQFYSCSQASFGCCHIGRGYCDWSGLLRCYP